jgi:hypothetical protein
MNHLIAPISLKCDSFWQLMNQLELTALKSHSKHSKPDFFIADKEPMTKGLAFDHESVACDIH